MKKTEFVTLCLRLLGIYLFIIGLSAIGNVLSFALQDVQNNSFYHLGPAIYLFSGAILFLSAKGISKYIVDFSEADDDNFQVAPAEQTTRVALLIIGIFVFVNALPQVINLAVEVAINRWQMNDVPEYMRAQKHQWTTLIGPGLKLLISIGLIIGPDKVTGFLGRYDETFKKLMPSDKEFK
jgi:hypothetical protein